MQEIIDVTQTLAAPAERVWPALEAFGGLERWFGIIDACRVTGTGVGAVRELRLGNGELMVDVLTALEPAAWRLSYFRERLPFPVTDYHGEVSLRAVGAGECELLWRVSYEVQADQRDEMANLITAALTDGVAGLARELIGG